MLEHGHGAHPLQWHKMLYAVSITRRLHVAGLMMALYTCSLGYFRFYVILGFFIILSGSVIGIFLPLWEARHLFFKVTCDTGQIQQSASRTSFHLN